MIRPFGGVIGVSNVYKHSLYLRNFSSIHVNCACIRYVTGNNEFKNLSWGIGRLLPKTE